MKQNPDNLQEVQNYMNALDYGLKRLMKEIHEHLMQGIRSSYTTLKERRRHK